jgi:hypothetical protein
MNAVDDVDMVPFGVFAAGTLLIPAVLHEDSGKPSG